MNPMLMPDSAPRPMPGRPSKKQRALGMVTLVLKGILRFFGRLMFSSIFRKPGSPELRIEDGTRFHRFLRSLLYRLAFVPVVIVLFVIALVFAVTHSSPAPVDPENAVLHGVYFDPITIKSEDGTELEAWLVPVYDARKLVEQKEYALKKKHPAIVLAHEYGGTKEQMIPLVKPLHDAGMVVLVLGMRGTGPAKNTGHTFGLNEALDIRAAMAMLRERTYVDGAKISLLGVGTGANAAMVAASQEDNVASLVLSRPVDGFEKAFTNLVGIDNKPWLKYITPMCQWTFEAMYHVDADDLNVRKFDNLPCPTLRLYANGIVEPWEASRNIEAVCEFLRLNKAAPTDVYVTLPKN
jgi:hypothetical protein